MDEKLIQEALAAHEEAFRLGARSEEMVWNLAQLYDRLGRPVDRGRILEEYAEQCSDSAKAFHHMHYMYFRDRVLLMTRMKKYQEAIGAGREFL